MFSSSIPSTLTRFSDLLILNLSSNSLSGPLPIDIGNWNVLTSMDFSNNYFSSDIPIGVADLKDLIRLSLSNNRLIDSILESLGDMLSLEFLDLSRNNLFGEIPKSLVKLPYLKSFNVSFNRLQVEIPEGGSFGNFSIESYKGNEALCGAPQLHLPSCKTKHLKNSKAKAKLIIYVALQIASIILVMVLIIIILRSRKRKDRLTTRDGLLPLRAWRRISYHELHQATNGSYGSVYQGSNHFLDILKRLNILIDVASALEYLHHGNETPVVHCDLKPNNILLDEDMVAHLSDFGIAKLLCGEDSIIQTLTIATIGYMAPAILNLNKEYGIEGIVSTKGDVYSFGILMMETITRKKPTDEMFTGEGSLKSWVKESISYPTNQVVVVDTNLLNAIGGEHTTANDCALSILQAGLECSAELPDERPDMKETVTKLKKIRAKFLNKSERFRQRGDH
ncbi:hypothetical protein GQ457_13G004530 [Hibiscus cannabinus]